jgi:hypothetical protein
MVDRSNEAQSQLYLLRIWATTDTGDALTCRGKLQPVLSDQSYCFTDATELYALLHTLLAAATGSKPDAGPETPKRGSDNWKEL